MNPKGDDRTELGAEDARFVEHIRAASAPPELGAFERAAFDARLRDRIESERAPRRTWRAASAGALLAAAAVVLVLTLRVPPAHAPQPAPASDAARDAFATALLLEDGSSYREVRDDEDDDGLPPQFAAIESALFE